MRISDWSSDVCSSDPRLIDLGADSRYRRPAGAGVVTQGAHQLVDLPSGHPVDPGLTDYCVETLVDSTAGVQQRREERPFPQFCDLKIYLSGSGRERLPAGPVAAPDPLLRPPLQRSPHLACPFRVA